MELEHGPVVGCVVDQEQHQVEPAVTQLERSPAVERLNIPQSRLCLDGCGLRIQFKHDVPSSSIAWDRKWYLGSNEDAGRQLRAQPPDECELRGVKWGPSTGVGADREGEPDGSCGAAQLIHGEPLDLTALDATKLRMRDPDPRGSISKAGGAIHSRISDLATHLESDPAGESIGLLACYRRPSHAPSLAGRAAPWLTSNWIVARAMCRRKFPALRPWPRSGPPDDPKASRTG